MIEILPLDFAAEYLAFTRPDHVLARMVTKQFTAGRH
jgi:hypothetical protein